MRREAVIANIMDQAITAFEKEDYDESMDLADQVLRKDPRNEQAEQIRDAAFRAGRKAVRADYIEAKREQFLGAMAPEYAPLVKPLRAMMDWDPARRPSGAASERMLLDIADDMTGTGLRRWCADAVPRAMNARRRWMSGPPSSTVNRALGRCFRTHVARSSARRTAMSGWLTSAGNRRTRWPLSGKADS